jgi:hypothetical protein
MIELNPILMGSIQSLQQPIPQTANGFTIISQGAVPEETILQKEGQIYTFRKIEPGNPYSNYYIVGMNTYKNGNNSSTEVYGRQQNAFRHGQMLHGALLARTARPQLCEETKASHWAPSHARGKPRAARK